MLFRESISEAKLAIKLQIFASDVDPDAIAVAREGLYRGSIEDDVDQKRLARFFSKEERGYRITPELRSAAVFTVQDILADPPFSRIDLVSCRNLLIYLRPEAQARVLSAFHFSLREGGILLLGNSETVASSDDRFAVISQPERLYRHTGRSRPGELGYLRKSIGDMRPAGRAETDLPPSRQSALAELCQRLVTEAYAPAAVLINRLHECLFSMGPTDRYLRVPPGLPTHDLLAMARQGMRTKLRSAIQQANQRNARVVVPGGRTTIQDGEWRSFSIAAEPVRSTGENLMLVCFVDDPVLQRSRETPGEPTEMTRAVDLERELEATREELQGAIHNLELSDEAHRAFNEEALSAQEEYQSTNEELSTSKEELQSLNEELTALNSQLQETLERQRTTANDLQNILYSTEVATLFLDGDLNIRFFTPASKALFNVIPADIGRPLSDLSSLAAHSNLLADARAVLRTTVSVEREVETTSGAWYARRILPYRTQENGVEGVVVTFADVTERRRAAVALETSKRLAEMANAAKTRFLAAASHDLRQPLQTLALIQGLLAKTVQGERARQLVSRLDDTLSAMSDMLNTLLDVDQIDSGKMKVNVGDLSLNDLLERLRSDFSYQAQASGVDLRVVPCGLTISSDPRLLEQMLRNLLSNALKYTKRGKVLLGCRRHHETVSIEVWDTGIGIPEKEQQAIFEEYFQLDNPAREGRRGLGLGLSIVRRLAQLLSHRVDVRSSPGRGSVFSIEVSLRAETADQGSARRPEAKDAALVEARAGGATILVIEDDSDVRDLLETFLIEEGHRPIAVADGVAALRVVESAKVKPDLILSDFDLPKGLDGAQTATKLREALRRPVPVVMLTGDLSARMLQDIVLSDCALLSKPVKLKELTQAIRQIMPSGLGMAPGRESHLGEAPADPPPIYIVDNNDSLRETTRAALEARGQAVQDYATSEAFLESYRPGHGGCLVVDAYLPGMSGLELLQRLHEAGDPLPVIMVTGNSDVPTVVRAMKAGAADFIEQPIQGDTLLASIERAIEQSRDTGKSATWRERGARHMWDLTPRQRQILDRVLAGKPSKNIAIDLGISQRTVENHRASIMKKTGTRSLPELARLALAAGWRGDEQSA